jgi:hypothetical protein
VTQFLSEEEFIELAANRIRRVATPEGAQVFGQPIGTIITKDMEDAAKAKNGGKLPKGALKSATPKSASAPKNVASQNPQTGKINPGQKASDSSNYNSTPGQVAVKTPSLSGPNSFKVGASSFSAPLNSKLIRPKNNANMAYVLDPDGTVHAFNEEGEVEVPEYLQPVLKNKFSSLEGSDDLYTVEEFDVKESKKLSDEKQGSVLSKDGQSVFTKNSENTWINEDLGVTLTDDDLQPLFDNGGFDLTSGASPEQTDFSSMTPEELEETLNNFPAGKKLKLHDVILTKQEDDSWVSSATGTPVAVGNLKLVGSLLSEDVNEEEAESSEKSDPLRNPSVGKTKEQSQKEIAKANLADSEKDVFQADNFAVLYHDKLGPLEKERDQWYSKDGTSYSTTDVAHSARQGFISKEPWTPEDAEQESKKSQPVEKEEDRQRVIRQGPPKAEEAPAPEPKVSPEPDDSEEDETTSSDKAPDTEELPEFEGFETQGMLSSIEQLDALEPGDALVFNDSVDPLFFIKNEDSTYSSGTTNFMWQPEDFLGDDSATYYIATKKKAKAEKPSDPYDGYVPDGKIVDDEPASEEHAGFKVPQSTIDKVLEHLNSKGVITKKINATTEVLKDLNADIAKVTTGAGIAEAKAIVDSIQAKHLPSSKKSKEETPEVDDKPQFESLDESNTGMTKKDVESAISALEGHTGFQVKYGLKSLPDEHPLKANPEYLETVQIEAKEAYPDLSPKKALIAHLKSGIGIEDEAVVEKTDEPADIRIGSGTPKTTQTGVTGGNFTKTDVQNAINILENYQGKIFKSELNKQGNPLGQLSPNDIVGFNKDKTITKQKFLDLLKKKLEDYESSSSENDADAQAISDDSGETSEPPHPDYTVLGDEAPQMQIGTVLKEYSPYFDDGPEWVKIEEGLWQDESDGETINEGFFEGIWFQLLKEGDGKSPSEADRGDNSSTDVLDKMAEMGAISSEEAENLKAEKTSTENKVSEEALKAMGIGQKVYHLPSKNTWTKMSEDNWESDGSVVSTDALIPSAQSNYLKYVDAPDDSSESEDIYSKPIKELTEEDLDKFPVGKKFSIGTQIFEKTEGGNWKAQNSWGNGLSAEVFAKELSLFGNSYEHADAPSTSEDSEDGQLADWEKELLEGTLLIKGDILSNPEHLDSVKDGESVHYSNSITYTERDYVKSTLDSGETIWTRSTGYAFTDEEMKSLLDINGAKITFNGSTSTADKNQAGVDTNPEPLKTLDDLKNFPLYQIAKGSNGHVYQKHDDGWTIAGFNGVHSDDVVATAVATPGGAFILTPEVPQNPHNIPTGKFTKTGKTHIYVNSDGSGIYQGLAGKVTALTVEEVKEKWDEGWNKIQGWNEPPQVSTVESLKKSPSTAKKVGDINDLPDGKYYLGSPKSTKAQIYEVTGDKVLHTKPLTAWEQWKVGTKPDSDFIASAPDGAVISSNYLGNTLTRKDGKWINEYGSEVNSDSHYLNGWYLGKFKIEALGKAEPVEIKKSALKTKFLTGKLLDSTATSVVPKGYSGNVTYFGIETTIPNLVGFKNAMDTSDASTLNLAAHGLNKMDQNLAKEKIKEVYGDTPTIEDNKKYLQDHLSALLATVDTTPPESNASAIFEFDDMGAAKKPVALSAFEIPGYYSASVGEMTTMTKQISAMFGDGTEIGQLPTTMKSKQTKLDWMKAIKDGNFKKAYDLEFNSAVAAGKSLPKGYAHPGYPDNEETHQIKWAPAVPGEKPVGTVEGDWSNLTPTDWSLDEVNNYLISAQMQNPTYLTNSEKRLWIHYHKNNENQGQVDLLSAKALQRKQNGDAPLSDPISWTDNIVPAKSYDSMFEDTDYPQNWTAYGNTQKAFDWYKDNPDKITKADLKAQFETTYGYEPTDGVLENYETSMAAKAVQAYFEQKEAEYQAELLKPVYTKTGSQTKGSHPGAFYTDQFGKKYYYKWWNNEDKLSNYRLEIEHAGNKIGRAFGFKTADSKLVNVDGHYGQMQDVVDGIGDMTGFDYSTITPDLIADVEGEHLLDWMLQNDDTKADNIILTADGRAVGIDKARSFKDFGAVNWDHNAPDGNLTVYTRLYTAIKNGQVSKETLDAAYMKIRKNAQRMQKMSDNKFFDLIEEGSKNRESWTISYTIDGKKVSQDLEGLKAAFADQKSKLVEKIEAEWAKLYKQAGHGELPEIVIPALGEGIISGLDSPELHEQVFQAKASGKTAMIGGSQIIGGTALLWTEQETTGVEHVMGEMFLAPKAQTDALAFWTKHAGNVATETPSTKFGPYDTYGTSMVQAAKTISTHSVDGAYNTSTIETFEQAKEKLSKELAEWKSDLPSNATANGLEAYKFSTGAIVPKEHLAQYKLMLDYYDSKYSEVHQAYLDKVNSPIVSSYDPIDLSPDLEVLTSPEGDASYTAMFNGQWLKSEPSGVSVVVLEKDEIKNLKSSGWKSNIEAGTKKLATPMGASFKVNMTTFERTGTFDAKTNVKTVTGQEVDSGTKGSEYQATLPTGEVIYWRNADHTNTARGQHGKLSFKVPNAADPSQLSASMARIQEFLDEMGIENRAADHTDAELTYWREMYGVLENRNHNGPNSGKFKKTYASMKKKVEELGGDPKHFLENLSASMTPDEEVQYWRDLWSAEFGDKVDELIQTEGYLPKFDHQNLHDPELTTGKPYWERFDISAQEIFDMDVWLTHSTGNVSGSLGELESGALLGGEERIRQLGKIFTGGGYGQSSALSDQNNGSSHQIYTRMVSGGTLKNSNNYVLSPRLLLRTRTYSLTGDQYGKLDSRKSDTQSDLKDLVNNHKDGGGETQTPHSATVLDGIEFVIFNDYEASAREEQIQKLKAQGLETIRGLPVEERLIFRKDLKKMIEKVKKEGLL